MARCLTLADTSADCTRSDITLLVYPNGSSGLACASEVATSNSATSIVVEVALTCMVKQISLNLTST